MTLTQLLCALEAAHANLSVHGDTLKVEVDEGMLAALMPHVREHKADLLALVQPNGLVGLREHLHHLAKREGYDTALVDQLSPADVLGCAGLNDAQLIAYVDMLADSAIRRTGKVPQGHTAAILCRACGPVWVHPGMAAALPAVDGWPRALGCPWCLIRKAGVAFARPAVHCADCRHFLPDTVNPAAGLGQCALDKGAFYPGQDHVCDAFEPQDRGLS